MRQLVFHFMKFSNLLHDHVGSAKSELVKDFGFALNRNLEELNETKHNDFSLDSTISIHLKISFLLNYP